MGFIAGIVDFEKPIDLSAPLKNLRSAVARRTSTLHLARAMNGFVVSQDPLQYFPNQKGWLGVAGFIDSRLCDLNTPDAESILTYTPLEGEYSLFYTDVRRRNIFLRRQLLGTEPLYYSFKDGQFIWGSDIKAVLALRNQSVEVDEVGVFDQLLIGKNSSADIFRTAFQNVFSLEPGFVLKVSPDSIKKTASENFKLSASSKKINFNEACHEFTYRFENSIKNKCRGRKFAISLSGGLDSSSIFATAHGLKEAIGHEAVGLTYTPATSEESQDLKELERKFKFKSLNVAVDPVEGNWGKFFDQIWFRESPMLDPQWSIHTKMFEAAKAQNCKVLLSGQWGDQLMFSRDYLMDFAWSGRFQAINAHLKTFGKYFGDAEMRHLKKTLASKLIIEGLPPPALLTLRKLKGLIKNQSKPSDLFKRNWGVKPVKWGVPTRSFSGNYHQKNIFNEVRSKHHFTRNEWGVKMAAIHGLNLALPYLDTNLIQFLLEISGDLVCYDGVPRNLLKNSIGKKLPPTIQNRIKKAIPAVLGERFADRDLQQIISTFSSKMEVVRCGWVDFAALNKLVKEIKDGGSKVGPARQSLVFDIYALELWLNTFTKQFFKILENINPETVKIEEAGGQKSRTSKDRVEILGFGHASKP